MRKGGGEREGWTAAAAAVAKGDEEGEISPGSAEFRSTAPRKALLYSTQFYLFHEFNVDLAISGPT